MRSKIIAAVTALSLAFTVAATAPASALGKDDERALRFILGAAALGLVIKEINDNNRKKATPVYRQRNYQEPVHRWDDRNQRHRIIPAQCVTEVRTQNGRRDVVSRNCAERFGIRRDLPNSCAFDLRDRRGIQTVYGTACLARKGFRIEEARRR